jgi:hypothetical protein
MHGKVMGATDEDAECVSVTAISELVDSQIPIVPLISESASRPYWR